MKVLKARLFDLKVKEQASKSRADARGARRRFGSAVRFAAMCFEQVSDDQGPSHQDGGRRRQPRTRLAISISSSKNVPVEEGKRYTRRPRQLPMKD
jgi:hypothetical protein